MARTCTILEVIIFKDLAGLAGQFGQSSHSQLNTHLTISWISSTICNSEKQKENKRQPPLGKCTNGIGNFKPPTNPCHPTSTTKSMNEAYRCRSPVTVHVLLTGEIYLN